MTAGELSALVEAAAGAAPNDRIRFRDPIALHGADAVRVLAPMLADPVMRSFAIRTIEHAAAHGAKAEAIAALKGVPSDAPPHVLADVDEALARMGARRSAAPPAGAPTRDPTVVDDDLYAFLVAAARRRQTVSYTAAGEVVGLSMRNPYHRKLLGQHLGAISEHETLHGRPMLSSIVVHKDSKKLGSGFYQLGEELRHKSVGEDEDTFAERELIRTFEHWGGAK